MKEKSKPLCAKNKRKTKFMKIAVIVVLSQVFLYTWVHLILSTIVGTEIAPSTSNGFYAFCGAEAGFLALLRKFIRSDDKDETEMEDEVNEGDFNSETEQS